jgi:hypothetical protein
MVGVGSCDSSTRWNAQGNQCREVWKDEKPGIEKMPTSKRFPTVPRRAGFCSRTKVELERVSVGFRWYKTVVPLLARSLALGVSDRWALQEFDGGKRKTLPEDDRGALGYASEYWLKVLYPRVSCLDSDDDERENDVHLPTGCDLRSSRLNCCDNLGREGKERKSKEKEE